MTDSILMVYSISDGRFFDTRGRLLYRCYSGKAGLWRDNPRMTNVKEAGPIPTGMWQMGRPYHSPKVGPIAIPLSPIHGTETHARSAFLIHGDNAEGDASEGCIIAPRPLRAALATSLEAGRAITLMVIAALG